MIRSTPVKLPSLVVLLLLLLSIGLSLGAAIPNRALSLQHRSGSDEDLRATKQGDDLIETRGTILGGARNAMKSIKKPGVPKPGDLFEDVYHVNLYHKPSKKFELPANMTNAVVVLSSLLPTRLGQSFRDVLVAVVPKNNQHDLAKFAQVRAFLHHVDWAPDNGYLTLGKVSLQYLPESKRVVRKWDKPDEPWHERHRAEAMLKDLQRAAKSRV